MEGRKRKMEWRVWKREAIISLWLHILLVPELFDVFFFEYYFFFDLWVEVDVSDDNDGTRIQVLDDHNGNCRRIQVCKFCNGNCF